MSGCLLSSKKKKQKIRRKKQEVRQKNRNIFTLTFQSLDCVFFALFCFGHTAQKNSNNNNRDGNERK
jgi:hypothetical protein